MRGENLDLEEAAVGRAQVLPVGLVVDRALGLRVDLLPGLLLLLLLLAVREGAPCDPLLIEGHRRVG